MDSGVNQEKGHHERESLKREYLCLPTEEGFPARGGRLTNNPHAETQLKKRPNRSKTTPVNRSNAQRLESFQMHGRGITLVFGESIARVQLFQRNQLVIALHLGEN